MKNTEDAFSSIKQFGYLSLYIGGNGDSVEVFRRFSCSQRIKLLNTSKTTAFFRQFQVTFRMYLDIERDDDDYDDGESSGEDYYE